MQDGTTLVQPHSLGNVQQGQVIQLPAGSTIQQGIINYSLLNDQLSAFYFIQKLLKLFYYIAPFFHFHNVDIKVKVFMASFKTRPRITEML